MEILVGADPEIFMFQNGVPISAHGMIRGNKHDPFVVKDGAVQVDGMALEFNIDPASTEDQFVHNITSVMETLKAMVPGYDLIATPVAEFGHDYIKAQPKEALELGCDPDFNAWKDGAVNPRPQGDNPFRTGAGHVHIGWTKDADIYDAGHVEAGIMLTKQLDFFLGLPSLFYDSDPKRRTMYGAAGAFRPKSYGVEYRVLSNAWLNDPKLMAWVYRNTVSATKRLIAGDAVYNSVPQLVEQMAAVHPNLSYIEDWMVHLQIPLPPAKAKEKKAA